MATIVAKHRIMDPERFFAMGEEVTANAPEGVRARQFCPSEEKDEAVCLWEADSVDALSGYLDPASAGIAENTYYVVDQEFAFGLPQEQEQAAAS